VFIDVVPAEKLIVKKLVFASSVIKIPSIKTVFPTPECPTRRI
jgi:hypothetical protein